jgi:hypothetical protein
VRRWAAAHKGCQAAKIRTVLFEWHLFLQTKCLDDFFVGATQGSQYSRPPDDISLEIARLLKKIDDLQNCTTSPCVKNGIAHRTDRFVVLWSIVLVVPINMMNDLPLESPEATVATSVIVTSADAHFYFFPNSWVFLVSNDACVGLTLDFDMKIPGSPGLRRGELGEELFILGTKCVFLG